MFIGGDSKSVRVLLDNGQVSEIPLDQTAAVEFAPRKPPAASTGGGGSGSRAAAKRRARDGPSRSPSRPARR